jgi:hypothetical protein
MKSGLIDVAKCKVGKEMFNGQEWEIGLVWQRHVGT